MTDLNPRLVSALGKLQIPVENYENHPDFLSLPPVREAPLWGIFQGPHYNLSPFELGALQNARCGDRNPVVAAGLLFAYPFQHECCIYFRFLFVAIFIFLIPVWWLSFSKFFFSCLF